MQINIYMNEYKVKEIQNKGLHLDKRMHNFLYWFFLELNDWLQVGSMGGQTQGEFAPVPGGFARKVFSGTV